MIINLWKHRFYILRAARTDLIQRHAGTGLGVGWYIVNPLAQIAIYSLIFSHLMRQRMNAPGLAESTFGFTIYLCSGLLPWIGFTDVVNRGLVCLAANRDYVCKLGIPEQVLFARDAISSLITTSVSVALLLICEGLILRQASWSWLALVPLLLFWLGFGFGLGMLVGVLYVFVRDIGQALQIILQVWMWTAPIVYVDSILPEAWRQYLWFNPMYPFVYAAHEALVYMRWPQATVWLYQAIVAATAVLAGYTVLRRCRPELRDAM